MTASAQPLTLAAEAGAGGTLLWVVLPYVSLAIFVLGHIWRYRYDKFGWTTRSSQLYERRLLRIGSPLFHFGILVVLLGHIGGLVIPKSWTEAAGISEHTYHVGAVVLGTIAGVATVGGLAILVYRPADRGPGLLRHHPQRQGHVRLPDGDHRAGPGRDRGRERRRRRVRLPRDHLPWFRSIFYFQPDPALMSGAPVLFQLHALSALLLFAAWPFTRLVHMLTAPLGYLTRPYIVYRSRDVRLGARAPHRGWERTGS